ncbi:hypothetical protein [Clostridium sardiniense]|uniref:hypothetical protein n=1 Tax=Clostridium sardiniense TaxID=29369 RepID=UPI00195A5C27|nr:hypothetical protein [Clostridium sardiniense]MBM7835708.1 hypothetical protein [Clostridium sardiniense]
MKNIEKIITKYHIDKDGNPQSIHIIKPCQVSPVHNQVLLEEIPDEFKGVSIIQPEGMYQVFNFDEIEPNSYYINNNSTIYFDKSMAGKDVIIDFHGIGVELIGADRIYTVLDANGNVIETLGDVLKEGKIVLDAIKTMGDVIVVTKELKDTVNEAKILEPKLAEDIRVGTPLDLALKSDINIGQPLLDKLTPVVNTGVELNKELPKNVDIANKANETLKTTTVSAKGATKELNIAIDEASELKDIKLDVEKKLDEIKQGLDTTKISISETEKSIGVKVKEVTDPIIDDIKVNQGNIKTQADATKRLNELLESNVKKINEAENKITPTAIINSVNESLSNGEVLGGTSTVLDKNKFVVKDVDNSRVELEKGNITAYNTTNKKTYYMSDSEIGICSKDNSDPLGIITSVYKKTLNDGVSLTTPGGNIKGVGIFAGDYAGYLTLGHDDIWGDDSKYDEYITFNKKGWGHVYTTLDFHDNQVRGLTSINRWGKEDTLMNSICVSGNQVNTNSADGNLWLNYGKGIDTYNAHQDDINVRIGRGWNNGQHGQLVCQDLWVHGSKHNIVNTKELGFIGLHAYEMAEPQFGDNGGGTINEKGYCYIYLDPIFVKTVNTDIEYRVHIDIISDDLKAKVQCCEKQANYFKVIGTPGTKFDWEVKCKRRNYETNRLDRTREKVFMDNGLNNGNLDTIKDISKENLDKNQQTLLELVSLSHVNKNQNIDNLKDMIKNTNKNNLLLDERNDL